MRRRRSITFGVLAIVGLLTTPVASAAPGQSSRDTGEGRAFNQCTGEFFDNTFTVHQVETESGPFHFNTHIEGIGETTGTRYVGNNVDNEFVHANPDGTSTVDQVLNVRVVSQGKSPDSWLTVHIHVVVAADGSVISGTEDVSFGCRGS